MLITRNTQFCLSKMDEALLHEHENHSARQNNRDQYIDPNNQLIDGRGSGKFNTRSRHSPFQWEQHKFKNRSSAYGSENATCGLTAASQTIFARPSYQ